MTQKRSKILETQILERLAEGELVTSVCRDDMMPSLRQLQRWRRDDTEFDDRCWSSEGQGLMVQRAVLIESMTAIIKDVGPGSSTQIQGLRELLQENAKTSGRLITRMSDRVKVDAKVEKHGYIIGWATDAGDIEPITIEADTDTALPS